uniref:Uncharacterized protein n=1 Tax=Panagrolaimus davidi TaxID=227884 RepID=A0A914Q001_9BILA
MSLPKEVEKSLKCLERFSKDHNTLEVQKMFQKLLGRKRKIPITSIQPLAKRPKKPEPKYAQLKKRLYDGEFLSMDEASRFTNFDQEQEETIEKMLLNQELISMKDLRDFFPPIKYGLPSTSKTPIEMMREKFETGKYLTLEELTSFLDFNQIGGGLQENKNLDKTMKDIENGNVKGSFDGYKLSHFLKLSEPKKTESFQKKYLTFESTCVIRNVHDAKRPDLLLDKLFDIILKKALEGRSAPHLLNLQLYGQGMDTPYYVPLRNPEQNNAAAFAVLFHELTQSEKLREIFNTRLLVKVCAVWLPEGGNSYDKGLTVPCSTQNKWCLARAIVYGINYLEIPKNKFDQFLHNHLEVATLNLMKLAGISEKKQYYSLEDAVKLQQHIPYRLIIFDEYKTMMYKGVKEGKDLCLVLKNRHYDFIKNPLAFLKVNFHC